VFQGSRSSRRKGKWHNEELCNFYASPYIMRMMTSSCIWWVGYVTYIGWEMHTKFAG
jgi:hypothetical protein